MALRRSVQINSVSGLCVTKLDVLDGLETVRICIDYGDGNPVYEDFPGWKESTFGLKDFDQLPRNAQNYLKRIEAIVEVPIDMISTGPDREETIVLRHPFE